MMSSGDAAIHRQPAVRAGGHEPEDLREGRRDVDRREARARHHQLPRGAQAQSQRLVQPHLLLRFEQTAVAAFGDEQLDLLGRVDVSMPGVLHPHQLQQQVAAAVEEVDRPRERALGPLHRDDGPHRRPRRVLQRERFGYQLADDHRQGREDEEDDNRGGGLGGLGLEAAHPLNQGGETGRDRGLGVGAENQAREGDADLGGSDVAIERVRVFEDRQHPRRERVAVLGQPSQPAPARAHDGELRRHEQRRQQDQQGDDP